MKTKWNISFFVALVSISLLSIWNFNNRIYDWDLPGYLGCIHTWEFPNSAEKVKDITFSEIKKEASPKEFNDIVGTFPVQNARQAFAKNTQAFTEQLPYYKIKIGYNSLIFILYKIGFSAPIAVFLISAISYFFSGLLLFFLIKFIFPENYFIALFGSIGVLLLPPIINMSRTSTPDMFIVPFLLLFIYSVLKKSSKWLIFFMLLLITFVRPDYLTFTLSYLFTIILFNYFKHKKIDFSCFLVGLFLLVLNLFIINYYDFPGWKNIFFDSFIYRRPMISAQQAMFSFKTYLDILFTNLIHFKKISLSAITLLGLIFYFSKNHWIRVFSVFIFANIYIKFLLFPKSDMTRFFMGFVLLLFIMFLYALSKRYNGFKLNKIA